MPVCYAVVSRQRILASLREPLIRANALITVLSPLEPCSWDEALEPPEDVQAILGLTATGLGRRGIAAELGFSPETVRKYRRQSDCKSCRKLGEMALLKATAAVFGTASLLIMVMPMWCSLRTVERAVAQWRQEQGSAALPTVQFETSPGKLVQADRPLLGRRPLR